MSTRLKTIEYAFQQNTTSTSSAAARAMTQITLYIPEFAGTVTFKSVFVKAYLMDDQTTAVSTTAWRCQVALAGGALDTTGDGASNTVSFVNSGEHKGYEILRDATAYFVANWTSGTNKTFDCTITNTGGTTINYSAKVVITYEWDDGQATRIKTVKIPLESSTGAIASSLTELGTNQVPNLDTFLPESSKTYRDIFFEIYVNDGVSVASSPNPTLSLSLDGESGVADGNHEDTLVSARAYYRIWKRTNMTTNATHAFKVAAALSGGYPNIGAVLVVTYEYNHTNSTTIINSLELPLEVTNHFGMYSSSTDQQVMAKSFYVEEPATVTLAQSGIRFFFAQGTAPNITIAVGGQTARTYSTATALQVCGDFSLVHRFDSGAAQGSGLSLARGENVLVLKVYSNLSTYGDIAAGVTGNIILNYTSGKSSQSGGDANHQHTLQYFVTAPTTANRFIEISAFAPAIPESYYYLNNVGFFLQHFIGGATAILTAYELLAEVKTNEGHSNLGTPTADGWYSLGHVSAQSDGEAGMHHWYLDATEFFQQFPSDLRAENGWYKLDLEATRKYRLENTHDNAGVIQSATMYVTYGSIKFTVAGTASGYGGTGTGITVFLHNNYGYVGSVDTTTGGAYSFNYWDNTSSVYTEAIEDSTHLGRSSGGTATGTA